MHIPHELQDEFPGEALFIERLIKSNYEFGQLATHYDEVNRQIYRIESEEEPTADEVLERLKKQRLKLKDDIATLLDEAGAPNVGSRADQCPDVLCGTQEIADRITGDGRNRRGNLLEALFALLCGDYDFPEYRTPL